MARYAGYIALSPVEYLRDLLSNIDISRRYELAVLRLTAGLARPNVSIVGRPRGCGWRSHFDVVRAGFIPALGGDERRPYTTLFERIKVRGRSTLIEPLALFELESSSRIFEGLLVLLAR